MCTGGCDSLSWSDPHLLLGNPGTELGTRVTFSCIEGWILNGSSSSVCESDGWSDPIPTCTWEGMNSSYCCTPHFALYIPYLEAGVMTYK